MEVLNHIWQYIRLVTVWDIIDIVVVATLLYHVLKLVRGTTVEYLLRGVLILFGALLVSNLLKLNIISYLLNSVFQIGVLALIIIFQPELRRVLQQFGASNKFKLFKASDKDNNQDIKLVIMKTVEAVNSMSWDKIGALIVFERKESLSTIAASGTILDAEVSSELIKNIFYPKSPLHDGAVIISNGRIKAAGCILPLSESTNISKELGTRHRAGLGMSEQGDAAVVIVSEENSSISLACGGVLKRHLAPETLEKLLYAELIPESDGEEKSVAFSIKEWIKGKVKA